MIKFIAAIDSQSGIADEGGIPWQGKLPGDLKHFRQVTEHEIILMGYRTYTEFKQPLTGRRNLVVTPGKEQLRPGFERVQDARTFLKGAPTDVWVIGGAGLFADTIDLADELDLTLIVQQFHCTKFFPSYKYDFEMVTQSKPVTENNITYSFTAWRRRHVVLPEAVHL